MTPLEQLLKTGEELREKATPGPWTATKDLNIAFGRVLKNTPHMVKVEKGGGWLIDECSIDWVNTKDPRFIVHACNTLEARDEIIRVLLEGLNEFRLGHEHGPNLKHTRSMGDSYGWCDYCQTKVSWGPGVAEQVLSQAQELAAKALEKK